MPDKRITTDELHQLFHNVNEQGEQQTTEHLGIRPGVPTEEQEDLETLHIYPLGEGLYITKTPLEEEPGTIEAITESIPIQSATTPPRQTGEHVIAGVASVLALSLIFFLLVHAFYIQFLQITTVSITARAQAFSATQTIDLVKGLPTSPTQLQTRDIPPLTLTQQTTVPATGTFHQQPTYAIGYLTFYNGSFSPVTIPADTQLQGADGVQIVTDQDALVPGVDQSATPPSLGQTTVSAHAAALGAAGNIVAFDINGKCCSTSILVKNTQAFIGGQDAKTYTVVRQQDITTGEKILRNSLSQIIKAAPTAQTHPNEALLYSSCSGTMNTDHNAGDQATTVHISATETCAATAYNTQALQTHSIQIFTQEAHRKIGAEYRFLEKPACSPPTMLRDQAPIRLSITCHGALAFLPNDAGQKQIKSLIAGKPVLQAKHILESVPGIKNVSISDVGRSLPTDTQRIHLLFIYQQV